jgi:hypothetical protein
VATAGDDIERLRRAIEQLHQCKAIHLQTEPVRCPFEGRSAWWQGEIEVFEIHGHPKATWCYGWKAHDGPEEKFVIVLQIPPVISPSTAVRASIGSPETQLTAPCACFSP